MKKVITYILRFCVLIFLITIPIISFAQKQLESLNRGAIAVRTSASYVSVSWRYLPSDTISVAFNVYRTVGTALSRRNSKPITSATWFNDANSSTNLDYVVRPVINGVEQEGFSMDTLILNTFLDIPLQIPTGVTTPDNVTCTYSPNDCSVGDVDGDGKYEFILKWDPSNSKDNSQGGYTGNVYLDAYKLDGTRLWRIDLGKNIRAGAHYTQFMVYDLDGDGKAEVACKTAPGTKDGTDNFLSMGPAASDNDAADYRTSGSWAGFVSSGPEYLTIFNGATGAEMITVNYVVSRDPANGWGKSSETYNRVDRFLACIAYLDGEKPSLVMCRGYYGRSVLAAWNWRNGQLTNVWTFDSNNSGYSTWTGQGNHNLRVADVDNDGKDEIIYGSMTINDNGAGLYNTGLGHGDAIHLSDMDPDRPGLEVFACHESGGNGVTFRDAATGNIVWQKPKPGVDVGRGMCADISAANRGYEYWGGSGLGVYNTKGNVISGTFPSINHAVWWDGDLLREMLDGTSISKWSSTGITTLLTGASCSSNNSTKSNPCLHADLFGDWREEVIWRTTDNSKLRIYISTVPTNYRFYSLMHDLVYRESVAYQNVAYNQPSEVGFYLASDMGKFPFHDTTAIAGNKIVLNPGASYDSYLWSNGATTPFIEVDTSGIGLSTAKYVLTMTTHGAVFKDSVNVTFAPLTNINKTIYNFSVYPNPGDGKFFISTGYDLRNVTITVDNLNGTSFYTERYKSILGKTEVDITNAPSGIYILKVASENGTEIRKLIKK